MNLPSPTSDGLLLPWLLEALRPMNRTRVKQLLRHGQIAVNGTPTTRHDHPVHPGDRIAIAREGTATITPLAQAGIAVVFEDESLIVIDKPSGLLTVATDREKTDTAFARLLAHLEATKAGRPFVVHRLDRETSGLLLFARRPEFRDALQQNWDAVTKAYLAVVEGTPRPPEGIIDNNLIEGKNLRVRTTRSDTDDARRAISRYRVVSTHGHYSLVEVELETGRKHQIRVHMAGLGCPVIGDKDYGAASDPARRLGLHAWKLAFDHPMSGKCVELESALPEVVRRVVG